MPPELNKTEARQGRTVGRFGEVRWVLAISLAAVIVLMLLAYFIVV